MGQVKVQLEAARDLISHAKAGSSLSPLTGEFAPHNFILGQTSKKLTSARDEATSNTSATNTVPYSRGRQDEVPEGWPCRHHYPWPLRR